MGARESEKKLYKQKNQGNKAWPYRLQFRCTTAKPNTLIRPWIYKNQIYTCIRGDAGSELLCVRKSCPNPLTWFLAELLFSHLDLSSVAEEKLCIPKHTIAVLWAKDCMDFIWIYEFRLIPMWNPWSLIMAEITLQCYLQQRH